MGSIIGQIKSKVTKRIRSAGYPDFAWQSRFYDQIIRNEKDLFRIRKYINLNPLKWETDKYYFNSYFFMNKLILSEIFIHPVKSMGGISVDSAVVTKRGLQNDRRWLLVDENNIFITQRFLPEMALISTSVKNGIIQLKHKTKNIEPVSFPQEINEGENINVQIWKDNCKALHYKSDLDKWLSEALNKKCKLVFMPDTTTRPVDKNYGNENDIVSFADGFPFLIIGQSSLDDLNSRLKKSIPIVRFRPNFVFSGGDHFEEDNLKKIKIGDIVFLVVKPCARCVITTTDQDTSVRNKEPLFTLNSYRKVNNKVLFGQNLIHQNLGKVSVDDDIIVLERKQP